MISKTLVATIVAVGLASSGALAAPKKRIDQRAATRALNEQQLAMATNTGASASMAAPSASSPMGSSSTTTPAMPMPSGQVAPPAGETTAPMATPTDPAASMGTMPTEAAPPSVPPQ